MCWASQGQGALEYADRKHTVQHALVSALTAVAQQQGMVCTPDKGLVCTPDLHPWRWAGHQPTATVFSCCTFTDLPPAVCSLPCLPAQASLHQSNFARAVGPFQSQLAGLPQRQLQHCYCGEAGVWQQQFGLHSLQHTQHTFNYLQTCCPALHNAVFSQLVDVTASRDPVLQLLQWVVAAIAQHSSPGKQQGQQGPGQQQLGGEATKGEAYGDDQHQQEQQQEEHPAEMLRQVLDVLLSALLYRHVLSMQQ